MQVTRAGGWLRAGTTRADSSIPYRKADAGARAHAAHHSTAFTTSARTLGGVIVPPQGSRLIAEIRSDP